MKPFTTIAMVLFAVGAVVQLVRFLFGWEIIFDGMTVPVWASAIVAPLAAVLAFMLWRENRSTTA